MLSLIVPVFAVCGFMGLFLAGACVLYQDENIYMDTDLMI